MALSQEVKSEGRIMRHVSDNKIPTTNQHKKNHLVPTSYDQVVAAHIRSLIPRFKDKALAVRRMHHLLEEALW